MVGTTTADDDSEGSFTELRAFERDILTVLMHEGPTYGLGIMEQLEALYDEQIHHGRLYPNLTDLEEKGFLSISELDKRTNEYALTKQGFEAIEANREWLAASDENEDKEIMTDGGVVEHEQQQSIEETHTEMYERQNDNFRRILMLVGTFGGAVVAMIPIVAHLAGAMAFEVSVLFQVGFIAMCVSMGLSGVMLRD